MFNFVDFKYNKNAKFPIEQENVHIWVILPQKFSIKQPYFIESLSASEKIRGEKFYFNKDRHLYFSAHISLRLILSLYTDLEPSELEYEFGQNGKPLIKRKINKNNISFNLSHTKDLIVVGVTTSRQIGIDIEFIKEETYIHDLINIICTDEEIYFFNKLPVESRIKYFYKLWTRKEALLKANGLGLSIEPKNVFVNPKEKCPIVRLMDSNKKNNKLYKVLDISYEESHIGAVAVQGNGLKTTFRRLIF